MCNIVNSPCVVCKKDLPLHLGDYETEPEEVECFCSEHIPDTNVRVFTLIEDDVDTDYDYPWENDQLIQTKTGEHVSYPKGWTMGIRSLTDTARRFEEMNFPNVGADFEIVVKP